MPSSKSGGKRAVEKKHKQRDALRRRAKADAATGAATLDGDAGGAKLAAYIATEIAHYKRLFRGFKRKGKTAAALLEKHIALLDDLAERALTDPGIAPEQAREQAARFSSYVVKAADPKRVIDELGAELREAHAVILGLKADRGPQEPAGDPARPPPAAAH